MIGIPEHPIGLIGLGRTGLPVARNLLARGRRVLGYRRSGTAELADAGGIGAANIREIPGRATTILTILPSADALADVIAQLLPALTPMHTVIELGSHPLADKLAHQGALAARGATFLDGEISGTPAMTAARSAVLLVAGDPTAAEAILPVLRDASDHARYVGPFGGATKLKLIANHLVAVHTVAAAEAMLLVERAGIDAKLAIDVLGLGAGSSTMFKARAPSMAARQFVEPAPGPVEMLSHYLDPIDALAAAANSPLPLFEIASALFRAARADGRSAHDIGCVIELLDAHQKGRPS